MERAELRGSRKVTCGEATRMMEEGTAWKAWFRPDGGKPPYSDDDPAYVWEVE